MADARTLRLPSADAATLRQIFYIDPDNQQLFIPLTMGVLEPSASDLTRIALEPDPAEEAPWEDWYRVDLLVGKLAAMSYNRGCQLMLTTEPPSDITVRCLMGTAKSGREMIFIGASHLPQDNGVQGHDVWQRAVRRDGEFVLEAELTDEMLSAAGRLMMVALRGQGLSPLEVFVSFIESASDHSGAGP